jgi:uncharacterized DUF497 family protein
MARNQELTVVYKERDERIRVISARRTARNEKDYYHTERHKL